VSGISFSLSRWRTGQAEACPTPRLRHYHLR
jgi:hypothetical protein